MNTIIKTKHQGVQILTNWRGSSFCIITKECGFETMRYESAAESEKEIDDRLSSGGFDTRAGYLIEK